MQLYFYTILVFTFSSFQENQNPYTSAFLPATASCEFVDPELSEISGMVASIKNPGHFWVINDSGNSATIYLLNKNCDKVKSFHLHEIINFDWEDITIYYDKSTKKSSLFIGDIGDNNAIRKCINIIEIDEPELMSDTIITDFNYFNFQYPDHARDAETLVMDPNSRALYVISKREKNVGIYQAPNSWIESDTMQLAFKGKLPFHNVTAGDISMDGKGVLLKNYNAIFYWERAGQQSFVEVVKSEHQLIKYNPEPQGESICWELDASRFYTLSEKSWAKNQILYVFQRNRQ